MVNISSNDVRVCSNDRSDLCGCSCSRQNSIYYPFFKHIHLLLDALTPQMGPYRAPCPLGTPSPPQSRCGAVHGGEEQMRVNAASVFASQLF